MKTIVMGKKIKRTYEVEINKDDNGKYLSKPEKKLVNEDVKWEEILSYDAEPQGHIGGNWHDIGFTKYISLSEDEEVKIEKDNFRADLGCWNQYVDKVLEEKDNLKKVEKELAIEFEMEEAWNGALMHAAQKK